MRPHTVLLTLAPGPPDFDRSVVSGKPAYTKPLQECSNESELLTTGQMPSYNACGIPLPVACLLPILGVVFMPTLDFSTHILCTVLRARQTLGFISRVSKPCKPEVFHLVHSHCTTQAGVLFFYLEPPPCAKHSQTRGYPVPCYTHSCGLHPAQARNMSPLFGSTQGT